MYNSNNKIICHISYRKEAKSQIQNPILAQEEYARILMKLANFSPTN